MRAAQAREGMWYAARLIFESRIGGVADDDPVCEERIVLLLASDEASARQAALGYGEKERNTYRNEGGELVEWRLTRIDDLEELGQEPERAGWEVAARHFRPSDRQHERAVERRISQE